MTAGSSYLYQPVVVERLVRVERIPDGTPVDLQPGTSAQVAQALGSNYSLLVHGQLMRLAGKDASAVGLPEPEGVDIPDDTAPEDVPRLAWEVLRTCYDPEIPVDIVELGLVYRCDVTPLSGSAGMQRIEIDMTLTAPGCGMGDVIANDARDKLMALPHVGEVDVQIVFDPPWDRSRMSEAALLTVGL
ncbi:MAG: putative Fe-S cluster assembly protein SufT [Burkholderiales bacterium]|nr:putative Fe-S cluster assembly protein SufT [Burkholderiales bacterium]MBK8666536.1 putative Fe-S cluster assembly protein SufT [Burkholderiales bacterium]